MNKKLIGGGLVLVALIAGFFVFGKDKEEAINLEQTVLKDTVDISKKYLDLRILTDNTLTKASEYDSYESWNKQMTALLLMWEELDAEARALENKADEFAEEKISFNFFNPVNAISYQEINDIYDKAPAGKKIRTLAKHLGVDAKRAFKILEQTQNAVTADAYNEAGDEFQKLETSAVLIKDGCKVAGFVGGVIITGGTSAIAAGSALTKVAVVVTGADLVLEVSEDAANIGLGNNNDVSAFIGDVRKITEPAAAILTIADLPKNLATGFEKFNAFMFGLDNFRSAAQEGKVIGIALPAYEGGEMKIKIDGTVMDRDELEEWLEGQGYDDYDEYLDGLFGGEDGGEDRESSEPEAVEDKGGEPEIEAAKDDGETAETAELDKESIDEDAQIVPETKYGQDGKVNISLESPLEATFWKGQVRMWKLKVRDFDRGKPGLSYTCDWNFYNEGALIKSQSDTCHFTTIFDKAVGAFTAEVNFRILQGRSVFDENGDYVEYVKDEVEVITLAQDYFIKAPVDTYIHP